MQVYWITASGKTIAAGRMNLLPDVGEDVAVDGVAYRVTKRIWDVWPSAEPFLRIIIEEANPKKPTIKKAKTRKTHG